MQTDKDLIRNTIQIWMQATQSGNVEMLGQLMDEDVVFLVPGQPAFRGREPFIEAVKAGASMFKVEGAVNIQEIEVFGDYAYCWSQLHIRVMPHDGTMGRERIGPTLSIFKKTPDGRWVLFRDANLLTAKIG
jgi:uncharacterized protein (TIGR02246 family)